MDKRNRNTAIMLMAAGLFLLIQHFVHFWTVASLVLMIIGIYKIKMSSQKLGYMILGAGILLFFGDHFMLIVSILLISFGWFYLKSRNLHYDNYIQKQRLIESLKRRSTPWILKNMSIWHIIGEVQLDLSIAISEEKEITLIMQGIIGDIDIIVPDDIGVSVTASATFGQIDVDLEHDTGLMNKVVWKSSNFDANDQKINIVIFYLIGDIDIKVI